MFKYLANADTGRFAGKRRPLPSMLAIATLFLIPMAETNALAPPYISDQELARYPIIVVARWEKAPISAHNKFDESGKTIVICEAHTKLRVERVLKGDLKPGVFDLKFEHWCVCWDKDGRNVCSSSSSMMLGDVDDVTKPKIWFLKRERSWDDKDEKQYLSLQNYREIQPLVLEPFYMALAKEKCDAAKFLLSENPLIVGRALRYVCGGGLVFPFNNFFRARYSTPSKPGKILKEQADNVAKIATNPKMPPSDRGMALAIYADWKGKEAVPLLKKMLRDKERYVAAMAFLLLANARDEGSIDTIIAESKKFASCSKMSWDVGSLLCDAIKQLGKWKDQRLAPALIAFLETDTCAGRDMDGMRIPQIRARKSLISVTGLVFPYQVEKSMAAWNKVKDLPEAKRAEALKEILPCRETPFKAELVGTPGNAAIRITNIGYGNQVIAKNPSTWIKATTNSSSFGPFGKPSFYLDLDDFKVLRPGEHFDFKVELGETFFVEAPGKRRISLYYDNTGRSLALNAWIGSLSVVFDKKNWREKRVVEKVVEKWPNGNLKVRGSEVNGHPYGKWEYFNEKGDRIKEVDYSHGTTAICNPECPVNKGAGIIDKKDAK